MTAKTKNCANCNHYSAKVLLADGGGNGKCWKIMEVTVTHPGSYGIVDADFSCAAFVSAVLQAEGRKRCFMGLEAQVQGFPADLFLTSW